ncbi:MAG TPA: GspH/FimT family pseudopilin [bacterium]|jgi:type II secretory pathway pseudopilin PulG
MRTFHGDETGAGLLEVMIVVVIVGMMVALTIPSITSYNSTSGMRSVAQQLVSDFRAAQQRAVAQQAARYLVFTPSTGTITGYEVRTAIPPGGSVEWSYTLPSGVHVEKTSADLFPSRAIIFSPLGSVTNPGSSPALCVDNTGGLHITITISYATGRINLSEGTTNCAI